MKAKDAMFLGWIAKGDKPARLLIIDKPDYIARYVDNGRRIMCDFSLGAAFIPWKEIPASQIMECLLWTGFEIAEEYGVPVKDVTRELEKIEGFTDYWNCIGKRSCALH